jgi:hypothetical protein
VLDGCVRVVEDLVAESQQSFDEAVAFRLRHRPHDHHAGGQDRRPEAVEEWGLHAMARPARERRLVELQAQLWRTELGEHQGAVGHRRNFVLGVHPRLALHLEGVDHQVEGGLHVADAQHEAREL